MPKVTIDLEKCTNCGDCVDICPREVFKKGDKKAKVVKEEDCISCRACESICPAQAIKVED